MNSYYGDEPGLASTTDTGFLTQLPSILWQRKRLIIFPFVIGVVAAIVAILLLPRQYESSATLLVQSPSLPAEVIGRGNDSELIDRRVESLRQQIVNRPKLLALIETNQLYTSERARQPLSEVIQTMRENVTLTSIDADLNASRPQDRTIAFKLAYRYYDPRKTQTIAQSLMEQIVELNSTVDVAQANQTVQFLSEQAAGLKREIAAMESQVSELNTRYGGILSRTTGPMIGSGASYDVQIADLMRANQSLGLQRQNVDTADQRDPAVVGAEANLAAARAVYAESHPDVKLAIQRLAEAKRFAAVNVKKLPVDNIDQQIAFNNSQIATLRAAKASEQAQVAATLNSQSRAPAVVQQTEQIQQKLQGLYAQYATVSQRLMTAEAGARAADEQMGERLVVVDPPVIPDEPVSPNRLLILAGGVIGGLALGFMLAMATELFLRPIRTPARISAITGEPTLALVPFIQTRSEMNTSRWRRLLRWRRQKETSA